MEVRSLKEYRKPAYPDKTAVQVDSALLKTLPERWRHNATVCAALTATTAMLMTACTSQPETAGAPASTNTLQGTAMPATPGPSRKSPILSAVAVPLFRHGDGMGAFGCVSVAPPAFLTESEAFAVISEEAKREGIDFVQDDGELAHVDIPKTSISPGSKNILGYESGTLKLDGLDNGRKIAYEFVSQADIESWSDGQSSATVSSYDFIDTAQALDDSLSKADTGMTVAVFYDPHYDGDAFQKIRKESAGDLSAVEEKLKNLAKEDLRAQVRDFLAWLKAQGII